MAASHINRQQPYKMGSSLMVIILSSISCNHLVTVMVCGEAINDVLLKFLVIFRYQILCSNSLVIWVVMALISAEDDTEVLSSSVSAKMS